ncbi:MAG: hypothetical protein IKF83_00910 [Clostridia bacterium]|nr:hypothetical protein [Clostridia bacterium]
MKNITTKSKIICAIIVLLIIIGTIVVILKGFKVDIKNRAVQQIEVNIGKSFETQDIKQITNEVFEKNQVLIQKVEVYEDAVSIISDEITDEQKSNLVQKINEKYSTELKAEDITVKDVPNTDIKDIVKPYIIPIVVSTGIILVYIAVRFYKIGIVKSALKYGIVLVVAQLVLFSLMAITRFPIGRFTLPLVLFVYLLSALGITNNLEKKLKEKKLEEETA